MCALADIWSPGEALVRRLAEAVLASGGRPTKGMSEGTVGPRVESVVFELQCNAACPGSTMGARQMPLRHRRGVGPLWTVVLPCEETVGSGRRVADV